MNVIIPLSDDLARRLGSADDVARRAVEAFGIAEYQAGRLTAPELRTMLGIETRDELDGFLKDRGIYVAYTLEDVQRDLDDLRAFNGV